MFNLNKENIKDKSDLLAKKAKSNIEDVSKDITTAANEVSEAVSEKAEDVKGQVNYLIDSLRSVINQYSQASKVDELKGQFTDKANQLKSAVTEEVANAYEVSKQKAAETVKENPVGTLILAASAGLLLGYILASKKSSN
jgi:ElaB/YqjD/DUF883 family membrane-anchored ribosome-binding protein